MIYWAIQHRSENRLDGYREHFQHRGYEVEGCGPLLFRTRREARDFVKEHFAYFSRPDLRAEPHGWKMPRPVKVTVALKIQSSDQRSEPKR